MKLSVAMIVKNEEKNIERCLKALTPLKNYISYEVIVVDTGSNDDTINIAKKYTDKVYEHPWNGNFSDMRNISIKYCKGEWILVLDADEALENPQELVKFLTEKKYKKYNSATLSFKNFLSSDENDYILGSLYRLFRKNKEFYYVGRVHEQPRVLKPSLDTRISILHYGYSRDDYELMKYKYERNKELLLEDLKNGVEPIYTRFQLAQTYSMANEHKLALDTIKEAYALDKKRKDGQRNINVYHFYARELLQRANYEKAIEIAKEALGYIKTNLDFYFVLANSYSNLKKYDEAEKYYKEYFELHEKKEKGLFIDNSVVDYSFSRKNQMIINRIINFYNNKNYKNVIKYIEKENDKSLLSELYLYSLIIENKGQSIKDFFDKDLTDDDMQSIINVINKVDNDTNKLSIYDICKNVLGIDERLDFYITRVYLDKKVEYRNDLIKINNFYMWKGNLIKKVFKDNSNSIIEEIKQCGKIDINNYLVILSDDYECLEILYNYSLSKYLCTNIKDIIFIHILEDILIQNNSIEENKYISLVKRAFINNINYIIKIYNNEFLKMPEATIILSNYENMWFSLNKIISLACENKIEYIRGIKKIAKDVTKYKKVIEVFAKEIDDKIINARMSKEKEKLLNLVEVYLFDNKIQESLEILNELNNIIKYDKDILNTRGVALNMMGKNNEALLNLSYAYILSEDKFEPAYNIAIVLESLGRLEDAKCYYNIAYNCCKDETLKKELKRKCKN